MKIEKILIILTLSTVIVLLGAFRLSEYFSNLNNPSPTPAPITQTQEATPEAAVQEQTKDTSVLKFDKKATASASPEKIRLSVSADGSTFVPDFTILANASSPDAIQLKDGRLAIYANDLSGRSASGLVVSLSTDGEHWESGSVQLGSLKTGGKDPDVVMLPNGTLRLYMVQTGRLNSDTTDETKIVSAVSSDGINFDLESGTRFAQEDISAPDVVKIGEEWFMYLNSGTRTIATHSSDGLTFESSKTNRVRGGYNNTVAVKDGTYRQFYCENGIKSAASSDGITWRNESGTRIADTTKEEACDPSAMHIAGDDWLMYYTSKEINEGP